MILWLEQQLVACGLGGDENAAQAPHRQEKRLEKFKELDNTKWRGLLTYRGDGFARDKKSKSFCL